MPLPRQAYGIDFYGHEKGEILVAVDLCTREVSFWFLRNRKQENVARALLTGLILQKGYRLLAISEGMYISKGSRGRTSISRRKRTSLNLNKRFKWKERVFGGPTGSLPAGV